MNRLKLFFLFLLIFGISSNGYAQYKPKHKKKQFFNNPKLSKPLYRWVTGDYLKHGIQLSFGPTYTFTKLGQEEFEYQGTDTLFRNTREAKGRLGIFAEIGMVHITRRPRKIIQYFDWGLGFKMFGGSELTDSKIYDNRDTLVGNLNGEGAFYNGYLYGRFDAHNVFQMTPHLFLDNSLGVNGDYMILPGNREYDGFHIPTEEKFQGNLTVQLHYSFGLGIKPRIDKGFFFIPSIELPVLGIHEWNGGTPAFNWFSSKYYPVMLRLKLVWLFKKDPDRCPPVETNEMDRQQADEYKNR